MTRRTILTTAALAVAAAVLSGSVASAAPEKSRGNIVSINWDQLTMDLKDPQGRIGTWKFSRNASVKFTDGARFFPRPATKDLRPPMYVHFVFDNEVIQSFDVVELGFTPGNEESASGRKEPGTPRTVTGRLTAYDDNVKQIELEINGVRETFQLVSSVSMTGLAAGQRVQLQTEWSGQQELVHSLKILGK
jgi:hypothetical protein